MGSTTSTHEPLDHKNAQNASSNFKRHASCRGTKGERRGSPKRMDRLRRSFRDSFRRRKEHVPESSKPHLWQADEASVRAGTCTFHVKYLGCVEVYESRGMNVCEEALKVLRNSRRRPVKAVLFVSGDGLRVVEDETKQGLIVDQTIEKVSFCAPDRNHDKGFSYICRDGTTRRWMCHGFLALKESGERLSHAVGCAFAACLERKQRREKECGVTMSFDPASSTFTRQGSFRAQTITERLASDNNKNNITVPTTEAPPIPTAKPVTTSTNIITSTKPPLPTHAIERPHATVSMLVRQGSFRGFNHLNQASPFKRQLSLRITDLPSNLERTRSMSLEGGNDSRQPQAPPLIHLKTPVSPIPETSPLADKTDPVSAMCQQLSQGLQLLTNADDDLLSSSEFSNNNTMKNHNIFGDDDLKSNLTKDILRNDFHTKIDAVSFNLSNLENSGTGRSVLTPPATPPQITELPGPDQWLGKVAEVAGSGRPPPLAHLRAQSLDTSVFSRTDPFDAEWVPPPLAAQRSTNPFLNSSSTSTPVKAFEVQM
uniref:Protein numb n=1 Tax=Lygus hesperus TaxID=30085 RepID=A0A146MB31_LYGHE